VPGPCQRYHHMFFRRHQLTLPNQKSYCQHTLQIPTPTLKFMHRPPNHLRSTSAISATPKLQLPHTNPSNPSPPQSRITHNAPPLLPNRRPHGRFVRHAGRVWRPRPQEAHCGPRAHHELEHCGAVSGLFPYVASRSHWRVHAHLRIRVSCARS
jgi:hypothetical protein